MPKRAAKAALAEPKNPKPSIYVPHVSDQSNRCDSTRAYGIDLCDWLLVE
jgi:hypothetical protein